MLLKSPFSYNGQSQPLLMLVFYWVARVEKNPIWYEIWRRGLCCHKSGPLIIFYPFIAYNNARFQWVALCFSNYIFVPTSWQKKRGLLESIISAANRKGMTKRISHQTNNRATQFNAMPSRKTTDFDGRLSFDNIIRYFTGSLFDSVVYVCSPWLWLIPARTPRITCRLLQKWVRETVRLGAKVQAVDKFPSVVLLAKISVLPSSALNQ
jgi:hypothetical protein